jgi:hypothetical protein
MRRIASAATTSMKCEDLAVRCLREEASHGRESWSNRRAE